LQIPGSPPTSGEPSCPRPVIGTKDSLPALKKASMDSDGGVNFAAKMATQQIEQQR
jgi:hypothetical protein